MSTAEIMDELPRLTTPDLIRVRARVDELVRQSESLVLSDSCGILTDDDDYDDRPWTREEMEAVAHETAERGGLGESRWEHGDSMNRGDVVLIRFPHPSGMRGKKRPAVVVQSDSYSAKLKTIIVDEVTSNLTMAGDPACLLIDISTPEGQAAGVVRNCVVS